MTALRFVGYPHYGGANSKLQLLWNYSYGDGAESLECYQNPRGSEKLFHNSLSGEIGKQIRCGVGAAPHKPLRSHTLEGSQGILPRLKLDVVQAFSFMAHVNT